MSRDKRKTAREIVKYIATSEYCTIAEKETPRIENNIRWILEEEDREIIRDQIQQQAQQAWLDNWDKERIDTFCKEYEENFTGRATIYIRYAKNRLKSAEDTP